ncbi:hypothetical protein [Dactylosporangium sp. CA-233914]|uniref:hypothetical protein n=1 Tax=Dactylosporangium sp. CA-233914 TaxID=3239934 RepID=UPI003D8BD8E7
MQHRRAAGRVVREIPGNVARVEHVGVAGLAGGQERGAAGPGRRAGNAARPVPGGGKNALVRVVKQPTARCIMRQAIVVGGGGVARVAAPSTRNRPSSPARTLQQPATGSQKYSGSVRPFRRGHRWASQ